MGKEPDGHQALTSIMRTENKVAAGEAAERSFPGIFEVKKVLMRGLV